MHWSLYGTLGCHLCEQAEQLLAQVACARPFAWHVVDIAELPDAEQQALAVRIPVLSNGQQHLDWPFGLHDVMRLP